MPDPVVVCLLPGSAQIGQQAADTIEGRLHLRGSDFASVADHLGALFLAGHPIVGVMAAGIIVRALAPHLADKRSEPPVLALAEDGSVAVPLLGGHHGGNTLARSLADAFAGVAAVTTAGDLRLGVALDDPPDGWRLENPDDARPVMAALIGGAPGRISGEASWLAPLGLPTTAAPDADAPVVLSVDGVPPLIYRRQVFALGVGCARHCPPDALIGLAMRSLADAGRSPFEVAALHSVDIKSDEAAVHALARHLDVPARFFPPERLEAEAPRLANPSDIVFAEVGCHGVAEGAALAAAGPGGALVLEKRKSAQATCALARNGPQPTSGAPRGLLSIVGIGPGEAAWRTPEASRAISEAEELVGYGLYLDLLGSAAHRKTRSDYALGEEEARCRHALEAAGRGKRVALICSGDGGIYAMGALVMELLDRPEGDGGVSAAARRSEIVHIPGISALQAASARAGALLGYDFCAISLSDLLTPREAIRARITAAAQGDFVTAFYNPVSRTRRTLLGEAREILLEHRPEDTPVLLASNLGRDGERLSLIRLHDLRVDDVDMLTIVLVGSSASRCVASGDLAAGAGGVWAYTPRGYAAKRMP